MLNHRIIFTGSPGAGKTSVMDYLKNRGLRCLPEVPRLIIEQQQQLKNGILPQRNFEAFVELVYKEMLEQYHLLTTETLVFDRAIPDVTAYFISQGKEVPEVYLKGAKTLRYNTKVLFFEPWEDIYTKDGIRYESFEQATKISSNLKIVYLDLGYSVIQVPQVEIPQRAEFVLEQLGYAI